MPTHAQIAANQKIAALYQARPQARPIIPERRRTGLSGLTVLLPADDAAV